MKSLHHEHEYGEQTVSGQYLNRIVVVNLFIDYILFWIHYEIDKRDQSIQPAVCVHIHEMKDSNRICKQNKINDCNFIEKKQKYIYKVSSNSCFNGNKIFNSDSIKKKTCIFEVNARVEEFLVIFEIISQGYVRKPKPAQCSTFYFLLLYALNVKNFDLFKGALNSKSNKLKLAVFHSKAYDISNS